jgi:uncharacterized protein
MNNASSIHSPCVNICVVTPDGSHCTGCYRTLEEIAGWSGYSSEHKRSVLAECERRVEVAFENWA